MNIYGIGVDLVETKRIARALTQEGFVERCFTAAEAAYCGAHARSAQSYAARWAAKEAVAKAFGTGIGAAMSLTEIEVVPLPSGQPRIVLNGNAARHAAAVGVREIHLSLTHTEQYAAAYVIAIKAGRA